MRPRRFQKREHPHITATRTLKYLELMAARSLDELAKYIPPAPKARAPRKPSGKPLERVVLAQCLKALRTDPRVAFVWRMQSGMFQEGERYIRIGHRGLPDIVGMLKVSGRLLAVECKRLGGVPTLEQQTVLSYIRSQGGIAGVATSAAEALALIP